MRTIRLEIELTYDDDFMHRDQEEKEWFYKLLLHPEDRLILHSNDIGDEVGSVKALSIANETNWHRCAMCDEWYDPQNEESVRIHRHPEPQSGPPREQWRRSGLPYDRWIVETPEGREWNMPNVEHLRREIARSFKPGDFVIWRSDIEEAAKSFNEAAKAFKEARKMDNKNPLENFVEDLVSVCDYISIIVKKKKDWTRLHEIIYLTGMYIHHRQDACRERLDGCKEDALYYEREARKVAERLRSFLPK